MTRVFVPSQKPSHILPSDLLQRRKRYISGCLRAILLKHCASPFLNISPRMEWREWNL